MTPRLLTPDDAEVMAVIHAACFDKPWPALDMTVHVARDLCLGIGAPLMSFAILRRSDIDAEILTVATDPRKRGQGLAGRVLRTAEAQFRVAGLRNIFLEVAEDNVSARTLYKRLGFVPIGRRPGYYARPQGRIAAITYSLEL
ncbi:N-acetyltransferase GCN5 [Algimonas arctica]|uniref:N-acetyltransferase GCN5 n=1 Tax=Algimonas arctica TaxID=1479486 RepID=A0A8J3CN34_9PROT|nr:GNAT family N-acetyltransferase [Algimonas arctica]GHA87921.1 N-acetyltransferase GCN5 [Algimonas arctica]